MNRMMLQLKQTTRTLQHTVVFTPQDLGYQLDLDHEVLIDEDILASLGGTCHYCMSFARTRREVLDSQPLLKISIS